MLLNTHAQNKPKPITFKPLEESIVLETDGEMITYLSMICDHGKRLPKTITTTSGEVVKGKVKRMFYYDISTEFPDGEVNGHKTYYAVLEWCCACIVESEGKQYVYKRYIEFDYSDTERPTIVNKDMQYTFAGELKDNRQARLLLDFLDKKK